IINPQETEQVVAHDELWVPTAERVNISTTNAFTISADVPEILMQQFWYTITKIKGSKSYEFLLADKRIKDILSSRSVCLMPSIESIGAISSLGGRAIDTDFGNRTRTNFSYSGFLLSVAKSSRKSLGKTFKETLDGRIQAIQEESQQSLNPNEVVPPESNEQQRLLRISVQEKKVKTLLKYKMMKMLSHSSLILDTQTASNDKLRKSRIDILWGMFYRENVDYPSLIWEDIAYQIDHKREKRSRRENMPYPRFSL
ncbi:retrovirus-related pol polyprotein from transposon TNT 1-94, partial [Tanacetum coccineum]